MPFIRELFQGCAAACRTTAGRHKALPWHFLAASPFMAAVAARGAVVPCLLRERVPMLSLPQAAGMTR